MWGGGGDKGGEVERKAPTDLRAHVVICDICFDEVCFSRNLSHER